MSNKNHWWADVQTDYTNIESKSETIASDVSNDHAELIAAAPQLLEGLKWALGCLCFYKEDEDAYESQEYYKKILLDLGVKP